MPQIKEYNAPDRKLTLPAEGFAAFETAARRIGPAYNAAASDAAAMGKLLSDSYDERMWPWDFLDAKSSGGAGRGRGAGGGSSGGGGGGFKVEGDVNGLYNSRFGSNGQTSRAAGAIGQMFRGTPTNAKAQFLDGNGNRLPQYGTGTTDGLNKLPANKPNPYAPFGTTPYGYQQPPPVPGPLDANGNPIAGPGGYAFDPNSGTLRNGHIENPGYMPVDTGGNRVEPPPIPSYWDTSADTLPSAVRDFRNWVNPPEQAGGSYGGGSDSYDPGDYSGGYQGTF